MNNLRVKIVALMIFNFLFPCQPEENLVDKCCMNKKWQGMVVNVDKLFNMKKDVVQEHTTREMHFYDFEMQRLAILNLDTGKQSLFDYNKGKAFLPRGSFCVKENLKLNSLERVCPNKNLIWVENRFIGSGELVSLWKSKDDSAHVIILSTSCTPLSVEVLLSSEDQPWSEVLTTYYYNVTNNIKNEKVFQEPTNCVDANRLYLNNEHLYDDYQEKRSTVLKLRRRLNMN